MIRATLLIASLLVIASALSGETPSAEPSGGGLKTPVKALAASSSLGGVLLDLGKLAGMKILVDWPSLKAVGVDSNTPVAFSLHDATVEQALDTALMKASPSGRPLAWTPYGSDIRVTTQQVAMNSQLQPPAGSPAVAAAVAWNPLAATQPAPQALSGKLGPARSYEFDKAPLSDVMEFIRLSTGVNMHVNWDALASSGVTRETAITLHLAGVTPARALDLVMEQLSAGKSRTDSIYWLVNEGVLTVSTGAVLDTGLRVRVFDVGSALVSVPNFKGPRIDLDSAMVKSGGGSGGSLFNSGAQAEVDTSSESRLAAAETLMESIKDAIGQDMWQPTGKGAIRVVRDKLVISQTLLGFKLLENSLPMPGQ